MQPGERYTKTEGTKTEGRENQLLVSKPVAGCRATTPRLLHILPEHVAQLFAIARGQEQLHLTMPDGERVHRSQLIVRCQPNPMHIFTQPAESVNRTPAD